MSPHAVGDTDRSGNEPEPPQLVNGDYTGISTPPLDGTTSSSSSSVASEPIAIVGMGEIRVLIEWFRPLLTED